MYSADLKLEQLKFDVSETSEIKNIEFEEYFELQKRNHPEYIHIEEEYLEIIAQRLKNKIF